MILTFCGFGFLRNKDENVTPKSMTYSDTAHYFYFFLSFQCITPERTTLFYIEYLHLFYDTKINDLICFLPLFRFWVTEGKYEATFFGSRLH